MRATWQRLITCLGVIGLVSVAPATVLRVPSEYPTIQAGIDAAVDEDTVLVADGTYTGEGNRDIYFYGKPILVISENGPEATIIDCEADSLDQHRGFIFNQEEGPTSVLKGFTIRNAYVYPGSGGAMTIIEGSSPAIVGNKMTGNHALDGGGIGTSGFASPTIIGNTITGNITHWGGGAILCGKGSPMIVGNTITENTVIDVDGRGGGIQCVNNTFPTIKGNIIAGNTVSGGFGGGIYCDHSSPMIVGNTIAGNTASEGGGIYSGNSSSPTVVNTIFWEDSASTGREIFVSVSSSITVSYSDVGGGASSVHIEPGGQVFVGGGNVGADPLFFSGPQGDYYLSQLAAGQPQQSPCVDAGDPGLLAGEGTTRTDEECDAWPGDMGYHYPVDFGPGPLLSVEVTPISTQVSPGEDLWFEVDLVNLTNCTLGFEAWIDAYLPNGNPYSGNPVSGPIELVLGGNSGLYGVYRPLHIPPGAPLGEAYVLCVRTADWYPDTLWAEDCFEFAIVPPVAE